MSSAPDSATRPRHVASALRLRMPQALNGRAALSLLVFWLAVTLLVSARVHYGV